MRAARIQAREPSSGAGRALAVGARHIALLAEEVRSRGTSVDSPLLGALPIAALLSAGAARCLAAPVSITIGTPALPPSQARRTARYSRATPMATRSAGCACRTCRRSSTVSPRAPRSANTRHRASGAQSVRSVRGPRRLLRTVQCGRLKARYGTRGEYVQRVKRSARALGESRFILAEDYVKYVVDAARQPLWHRGKQSCHDCGGKSVNKQRRDRMAN